MDIKLVLVIGFYLFSLLCIYILPFLKRDFGDSKKLILRVHLVTVIVLLIEILLWRFSDYTIYGSWTLPIVTLFFMITGSLLIVMYWKTKYRFIKVYSGFFFFYPLLVIVAVFMSRLFAVLIVILPLASLFVPDTLGTGNGMTIRHEFNGVMAASDKLMLYKSYFPLERKIGHKYLNHQEVNSLDISQLGPLKMIGDSVAVFYNEGKKPLVFFDYRQLKNRKRF